MNLDEIPATTRRSLLRTASAIVLAGVISSTSIGATLALSGPEQHVSKIANSVIRLANGSKRGKSLHASFERLLASHANMDAVALFSLGRYRRKLPTNLKRRYQKMVKAYIAGLFVYYAKDFRGRGLAIRRSRKSGKSIIVDSHIKTSGSANAVKWRVYSSGNRHRVTDVNIRGVWLSIQMRQKFTQILKRNKGDFKPLMAFLDEYKNWMPKS